MKIHHYTSIETLALILKYKTIRFNRLDRVDDMEESMYGSGPTKIKLGQYVFVSCWTKVDQENISLWKMYTNYNGIRITLDEDMFVSYRVNETFKSYFPSPFHLIDECYASSFINKIKCHEIIYEDNIETKIKDLVKLTGDTSATISTDGIGLYKSKEWEFQHECRFKITLLPFKLGYNNKPVPSSGLEILESLIESIVPSIFSNISIEKKYIDIPLDVTKLGEIIVMLGPKATESERIIVESLLKDLPNAQIMDSYFKDKIRK